MAAIIVLKTTTTTKKTKLPGFFLSSRDVHLPVWTVQVHEEAEVHPAQPALQRPGRLRRRRGRDRLP